MRICIEKDDQGNFFVYKDDSDTRGEEGGQVDMSKGEQSSETPPEKQPAKDIKEALMMAGKLLMMGDQNDKLFDQGMEATRPKKPSEIGSPDSGMMG